MNKTVLFCAYKSVLCEGMTLETQYLGSRPTRACELKLQFTDPAAVAGNAKRKKPTRKTQKIVKK